MDIKKTDLQKHVQQLAKTRKTLVNEFKESKRKVRSIPIELEYFFKKVGDGNFNKGLVKASLVCKCASEHNDHETEKEIIMMDLDKMMCHLKLLFPKIYKNHLSNLPAFVRVVLDTEKLNFKLLDNGGKK